MCHFTLKGSWNWKWYFLADTTINICVVNQEIYLVTKIPTLNYHHVSYISTKPSLNLDAAMKNLFRCMLIKKEKVF